VDLRWCSSCSEALRLLELWTRDDRRDTKAINDVLGAQQARMEPRRRGTLFLVGYWRSPELTFSGSSGVSRGWDGVLARYKKSYPNHAAMASWISRIWSFATWGRNAALVLGQWHLKRESGDIGGVFTLVWQKFPDGWKIIHDHTSAVGAKQ